MSEKEAPKKVAYNKQAELRRDNLERIAANNLKTDIEDNEKAGLVYDVTPEEVDAAVEPTPIKAEEGPAEAEKPAPEPEKKPEKYKIKVHGKETELSLEELIARAQKVEAADQYLVEAREAAKTWKAPTQTPAPEAARPPQPAPVSEDDRALARAIQMGTEEEAVSAIRKLRPQSSMDMAQIVGILDDRLSAREAYSRFQTEFKDIKGDPFLWKLAITRDEELRKAGDTRPYWARYEEIGKEIRDWRAQFSVPAETQRTLERKATVTALPTAGGRLPAPAEEPEEDASATIAEMAKARPGRRLAS